MLGPGLRTQHRSVASTLWCFCRTACSSKQAMGSQLTACFTACPHSATRLQVAEHLDQLLIQVFQLLPLCYCLAGAHAASFNTMWNTYGKLLFYFPTDIKDMGPNFNFIAFRSNDTSLTPGYLGWMVQKLSNVYPANLYQSMKATRRSRLKLV